MFDGVGKTESVLPTLLLLSPIIRRGKDREDAQAPGNTRQGGATQATRGYGGTANMTLNIRENVVCPLLLFYYSIIHGKKET